MVWNIVPVGSIPTHEIYDGDGMIMVMEADDNGEIIMMMNAKL